MNRLKPTARVVPPPIPPAETPPPIPQARRSPLRTFLVRLIMVLVIAGSVSIAVWSIFQRLLPVSHVLRDRTVAMSRLANEVEQLDQRWNQAEVDRVEELFQETQESLFKRDEEVENWEKSLEDQALSLGLQPSFFRGELSSGSESNRMLLHRPLSMLIQPLNILDIQTPAYHRLLNLVQTLDLTTKRADLIEVSVLGDTNAVQQAQVVFKLWSPEKMEE